MWVYLKPGKEKKKGQAKDCDDIHQLVRLYQSENGPQNDPADNLEHHRREPDPRKEPESKRRCECHRGDHNERGERNLGHLSRGFPRS